MLGLAVGSDELIRRALDAILAGVDSPSLRELAALGRREEAEAHELCGRVAEEPGLTGDLPQDAAAGWWELTQWWCARILAGAVPPETGGEMIARTLSLEVQSNALRRLVGAFWEWEEWTSAYPWPRDESRQRIVDSATDLLTAPGPSGSLRLILTTIRTWRPAVLPAGGSGSVMRG